MAILDQRGSRVRQSGIRIGFRRCGRSLQARDMSAETYVVVGEVRRNRRHLLVLARLAEQLAGN
jgi:hypothetical protein